MYANVLLTRVNESKIRSMTTQHKEIDPSNIEMSEQQDDKIDEEVAKMQKAIQERKEKLQHLTKLKIEEEIIDEKIRRAMRDLQVDMNGE